MKNFLIRFGYLQQAPFFTAVPNLKYLINLPYWCLPLPVFGWSLSKIHQLAS